MCSPVRPLMLVVAVLAATVPDAGAQGSERLLDEVRVLTPHTLRALVDVAESGDTTAQFKVGLAYYYGYAVEAMPAEAARWFRQAAERGCTAAQHMLGVQLRDGNGVAQDTDEALRLLQGAADRGYPDAQYDYGVMLFDGIGVAQDHAEAYTLFSSAAARGSVGGQTMAGIMLVNGFGVERDPAEGSAMLRRAARAGSPMAQGNLGLLYANGVGVEQDAREALVWFYMAEAGGFDAVAPLIAEMTQSLAESDVTELRREAQQRTERLLAEAAGEESVGEAAPGPTDAEVLAALRELGGWFASEFPVRGTFTFGIRQDIGQALSGLESGVTLRGTSTISEVTLDGCRLHWTAVTVLADPLRWEWFVELDAINASRLRVQPWELPEGWRVVSGQVYAVHLSATEEGEQGYFIGVEPGGQTVRAWEITIPFRDRRDAEEAMAKLREGVELCAGR